MKRYLKKEWKLWLLTIIMHTIGTIANVGSYFCMMNVLTELMEFDLKGLLWVFLFYMIFKTTMILFVSLNNMLESLLGTRINTHIRNDISTSISKWKYTKYKEKEIGVYQSWYINDVKYMEELGMDQFIQIEHYIINMICGAVAVISINKLLLVVSLIMGMASILFTRLSDSKMQDGSENVTKAMETFAAKIQELLAGAFIYRTYNKNQIFLDKMSDESKKMEDVRYRYYNQRYMAILKLNFFNLIVNSADTLIMYILVIAGALPIGTVLGGNALLSMVQESAINIANLRITYMSSKPYFEKVEKIIQSTEDGSTTLDEKKQCPSFADRIKVNELSFGYDKEHQIFDKFSYTFDMGKKYAIIGKSGAGKSTLLKLLSGYLTQYQGDISIDNVDIKKISENDIFGNMTYISQDITLFNDSLWNNITLGEDYSNEEVKAAIEKASLTEDIASLSDGTDTIIGENGNLLSGGQRQRVALARAFLHDRKILLIDEGTSALDHVNAEKVVNRLLQEKDLTILFVSHTLSEESLNSFDCVVTV